jgi:hypothetical protein
MIDMMKWKAVLTAFHKNLKYGMRTSLTYQEIAWKTVLMIPQAM